MGGVKQPALEMLRFGCKFATARQSKRVMPEQNSTMNMVDSLLQPLPHLVSTTAVTCEMLNV